MTLFVFPVSDSSASPQTLQSIPAEKVMKKPIPEEHLILKSTFEALIQKCLAVATDPVSPRTRTTVFLVSVGHVRLMFCL